MTAPDARYWDTAVQALLAGPKQTLWRRHCDTVHADLLNRWLPPGPFDCALKTDLFDEALGEGLYPVLAGRGRRVVGIDLSPVVVRAARRRHGALEGIVADTRQLPFADASFDLIVSNSTLDHFDSQDDIRTALDALARALRPGGLLLVTLDNPAHPAVRLRNALPRRWLQRSGLVPCHVGTTCGRRRLAQLVGAAGLTVLQTTVILHCPRMAAVAVGRRLDRGGRADQAERFLRFLARFERLANWPTRFLTGHFVALLAAKPGSTGPLVG